MNDSIIRIRPCMNGLQIYHERNREWYLIQKGNLLPYIEYEEFDPFWHVYVKVREYLRENQINAYDKAVKIFK